MGTQSQMQRFGKLKVNQKLITALRKLASQSPRGAANIQQAQSAGTAVTAASAGTGTDFNIDVDLSGMPQREDYPRGGAGQAAISCCYGSLDSF